MANYYEILGVSKEATQAEIKSAFRKKARELHPDVNKAPDAEERFKELGKAYETLSNEEKRSLYDRYGEEGLANAGFDNSLTLIPTACIITNSLSETNLLYTNNTTANNAIGKIMTNKSGSNSVVILMNVQKPILLFTRYDSNLIIWENHAIPNNIDDTINNPNKICLIIYLSIIFKFVLCSFIASDFTIIFLFLKYFFIRYIYTLFPEIAVFWIKSKWLH